MDLRKLEYLLEVLLGDPISDFTAFYRRKYNVTPESLCASCGATATSCNTYYTTWHRVRVFDLLGVGVLGN